MMLFLLLACTGASDDTGSDTGAADPSVAALIGLTASGDPDADTVERALQAVGRPGAIDVTHTGLVAACDVTWTATVAFEPPATYAITYSRTDSANDPSGCAWTLDYALVPVPDGTWTVTAAGESVTVPVPG
jgi:hypothetical protein